MLIAVRVNTNQISGGGHFYRCLTLAKVLKSSKNKIIFICDKMKSQFSKLLNKNNFKFFILKKNNIEKNYEKKDISQTINVLKKFKKKVDLLIVDSYQLGKLWEKKIEMYTQKIMVIDDLDRSHNCNYYLNQNININSDIKNRLPRNCKVLLGPRYCILRGPYEKKKIKKNKIESKISNVLIFMGTSDTKNLTLKILKILSLKKFNYLKFNVVIGVNNTQYEKIKKFSENKKNIRIYYNLTSLAKLIKSNDITISSGGSSIWEFLYFNKPSLIVSSNKTQLDNSKHLYKKQAIKLFYKKKINFSNLNFFFRKNLLKKNFKVPKKITKIIDGMGVVRIKKEILKNYNEI